MHQHHDSWVRWDKAALRECIAVVVREYTKVLATMAYDSRDFYGC